MSEGDGIIPLELVIDDTDVPALFGVAAAHHARQAGARFMHSTARFDLDAAQFVFRDSGLGASGLFFAERILGTAIDVPSSVEAIIEAAAKSTVVVPIHPRFGQRTEFFASEAARMGIAWRSIEGCAECLPSRRPAAPSSERLAVLFIGRERDHLAVYPAALATLEEAAGLSGASLDVRFFDPAASGEADLAVFADAAGLLLPGGSDMANVPGQVRAAHLALDAQIPVLGLCLGMQTMVTAFAQKALAAAGVNLAEVDPGAAIKSFVAMAEADEAGHPPLPVHRTGEHASHVLRRTRLSALLKADSITVRYNHRYRLSPSLRPALEVSGLVMNATSHDDRVVDGIEWPGHPFFMGFQGHPELGAPEGAPHPVFTAFIKAILARTMHAKVKPRGNHKGR